jgi:UDP-N-acetyl-alpha-D-muramoyl-L-alanyl-L-glutamate epimerase
MLQELRELDRTEAVRRRVRILRNLIIDRLPRDRELVFHSYTYAYPKLSFVYSAQGETYVSTVDLKDISEQDLATVDAQTFHRTATLIGITMAPFHFLLTDFASVRIEPGDFIDSAGRQFFETYLRSGLAEFRYRQGLDPTRLISVRTSGGQASAEPAVVPTREHILLLNGGGKDTAVMAELAKTTGLPVSWCSINPGERHAVLERAAGFPDSYALRFRFDPRIRRNGRYKWGHTPSAAVYMALGLLVAVARRSRYVAIGNEYSASFGNIRYKGVELNHQYSKSYEYETAFQTFLQTSVVRGVTYFSLLRPFHDLGIAAMVSGMDGYAGSFFSCNSINGSTRWCGDCAKCAFTFLALMPWTDLETRNRIFGMNLIEHAAIRKFVLDLAGGKLKPWECVGTTDECRLALALALAKYPELEFEEYPRRNDLLASCAGVDVSAGLRELVSRAQVHHRVPGALWERIQPEAARLTERAIMSAQKDGSSDRDELREDACRAL